MSSKTHPKLSLTEDEMLQRIRQAQQEDRDGTLVHVTNEDELRAFFAEVRHAEV